MLPLLLAAASAPVFAIPPDQVATKLDSVLVFAPIDSKTPMELPAACISLLSHPLLFSR
jgi:hypothetical protein